MGQTYSLLTQSAGSAGIDIPELSEFLYERTLGGSSRFMKCIRAKYAGTGDAIANTLRGNELVIIKVIMKPSPNISFGHYINILSRERDVLAGVQNAMGYERIIETPSAGYLLRQYLHSSLYDRIRWVLLFPLLSLFLQVVSNAE